MVRECMIASSPRATPATASAAMAKSKFSHALRFKPMSRCGTAMVTDAPMTRAQINVTQLMGGR